MHVVDGKMRIGPSRYTPLCVLQSALHLPRIEGATKTIYSSASFEILPCQENRRANLDISCIKLTKIISETHSSSDVTDTKLCSWQVLAKQAAALWACKRNYRCG